MVPSKLRGKIIADRLEWIRRMIASIRALPLNSLAEFTADPRTSAAAESTWPWSAGYVLTRSR